MTPPRPLNSPEEIAYHESGHAIIARLFGYRVTSIVMVQNVVDLYNGYTYWDIDSPIRDWTGIPSEAFHLEQRNYRVAPVIIYAAGKAAERLYFRANGSDETKASFGEGDEGFMRRILQEIQVIPERYALEISDAETVSLGYLEYPACWSAVSVIAMALMKGITSSPKGFRLEGEKIQQFLVNAFAASL